MRSEPTILLTVGHGASDEEDFRNLLEAAEVASVVDVRIGPGSRKHPHFGKDRLEEWLPAAGIAYRWEQRLGGFRKLPPDSPDTALRNESFGPTRPTCAHRALPLRWPRCWRKQQNGGRPSCAAKRFGGAVTGG
ncbi:DUF488 domain-containing protein [Arthrobacter globiformis]|uniref:DUF488 domain-containing protein n=1 Tax=Arthrobacter globiformis TaxID=1665 RepID=UPI0027D91031|nr:DUF488 domain-containing protein [Arthrobacter globiformis]